ncbi:MAG: DUF4417 domain-containing protein [Coriobacteriia bacterium]|nr:DUF4417 domain-containing protein [Coriobacteriia bacterium]
MFELLTILAPKRNFRIFKDDSRFERVCCKPWEYVDRLSQYKQVMTPDVSCYIDMPLEEQWHNTFLNRIIGKYWQTRGLIVIPTISWSDKQSYSFAFTGIEIGCIVAVSTIGTHEYYDMFMDGFIEMCNQINPEAVVCYCPPYQEMYHYSKVVYVEYEGRLARFNAKHRPNPNQLTLFDIDYKKEVG